MVAVAVAVASALALVAFGSGAAGRPGRVALPAPGGLRKVLLFLGLLKREQLT